MMFAMLFLSVWSLVLSALKLLACSISYSNHGKKLSYDTAIFLAKSLDNKTTINAICVLGPPQQGRSEFSFEIDKQHESAK